VDEFGLPLRPMAKNFLSVIAQDHKEPAIGGSDRGSKLLSAEDYPLMALAKLDRQPKNFASPSGADE
jgi:hypothetical protein